MEAQPTPSYLRVPGNHRGGRATNSHLSLPSYSREKAWAAPERTVLQKMQGWAQVGGQMAVQRWARRSRGCPLPGRRFNEEALSASWASTGRAPRGSWLRAVANSLPLLASQGICGK